MKRKNSKKWVVIFYCGDFPYPGIESPSLASLTLTGRFFTIRATWENQYTDMIMYLSNCEINQILVSSFIQQIIFEHLLLPDPVPFNQRKTFLGAEEMLARRQRSSCPYAVNLMKPFPTRMRSRKQSGMYTRQERYVLIKE